ncbi:ferric reductase-like transmembrane domain-containing protein [Streptomyces sp. NRRL S-1813]|uniref:ferric reductase-like transmembrane domain-containing protein n=1 Tax=Streptomyces sp. NRRL S-1813 TaxID=1463888 RepID=UPI00099BFD6A|nr:ferric reductase-like transmembrane domain-containing protein [Streptomyces sp. NRRL S-1813]
MTTTTTYASRGMRHRRPRRSLVPFLVPLVIWGGVAGVLALWWSDTTSVVGPAGWLTGGGRITGLLAGYACAVLLALMARMPLLDHSIGTDRLARWHAWGGRCTVSLALAHTLLIIWGYSLTSHTNVVTQTSTLVLHYPDLLKGTAGFLLFVATGIVSARAARRRMSYETWHYLHFATYLAVFLTFGHQLSDGADFVGNRLAQAAWFTLFLGVAALLAWYRFAVPVRRGLRHRLRVAAVHPEAPGVVSVHLTGQHLDDLGGEPGQFLRWRFLTRGLWWTANPCSLSAPAHPAHLRITVKTAGGHSAALARLRPGTRVWAEGPYGADCPPEVHEVLSHDLAVATSGTAERGHHLIDPHTGRPADTFASLTLVGPRLTLTDTYATAAFARGNGAQGWVETLDGYEALAVLPDGQEWRTPGFSRYGS